ncbi:MAG TPA: EamA family transporter [Streptosporangiaceae bacterium]|nr:EamA family transporter [Streptosporangiaceae bacterium]
MSATALALILVAAVAHATWNLFSKQASAAGASSFVWLMSLAAAGLYAPVVAVSVLLSPPRLTLLDWVFMAGTGLLQVGYFLFLQAGYRLGDLSLVYPLGRGSGALLAALAGIALLGERPGPAGITGMVLVVLGVLVLGAPGRDGDSPAPPRPGTPPRPAAPARPRLSRAIVFALVTGTFIASYTLWDKYAVSTLKVPPLIQGYASLPVMALVLAPSALRQRSRTIRVWRGYRRQVTGAAVLSPLAYILVLIAMSFTAVSAVAPAREVSVLAGVLLGRRLLGEGGLARRLTAAAAIAAGIICIAVG